MKKVFTMIELIFAIVILSTLAAVAVPKLKKAKEEQKDNYSKAIKKEQSQNKDYY